MYSLPVATVAAVFLISCRSRRKPRLAYKTGPPLLLSGFLMIALSRALLTTKLPLSYFRRYDREHTPAVLAEYCLFGGGSRVYVVFLKPVLNCAVVNVELFGNFRNRLASTPVEFSEQLLRTPRVVVVIFDSAASFVWHEKVGMVIRGVGDGRPAGLRPRGLGDCGTRGGTTQ